ncbi:DUF4861 domain-containing protein [Catenovulum sp. 2E275]|uniref:DUF4861 domain-containing protein n=1 Tax=Catenovulum sp. 2E275 TaxID=2980497 RepID=UPI0021CF627F|nr:DUF4861 domain-containing protein [Catenovulum sp. 2E275]MCU4677292.1 DUF4861 domain-containing protein [Catenovulum sp. 2E275]
MKTVFKLAFAATLIGLSGCAQQTSTHYVQARFVPERADDFAFENDKVAFRVYGPALEQSQENNGLDCWFKRVDYPIIDKWYKGHTEGISYHQDHGEGYDPYHVGSSLGCGGIALWDTNATSQDKLIQPNVYKSYKVIEKTANKVVFELEYDYPAQNIHETKLITLEKGNQLFKAESHFSQNGQPIQVTVAIGVTTHDGKAQATSQGNTVTTWESIDDSELGTGVVLPAKQKANYVEVKTEQKDRSHALLIAQTDANGKITYYAGFAWAKAGEITNWNDWQNYMQGYLAGN